MKKEINVNLAELANGGLQEKVDLEIEKIVKNILDLNTESKKARKLNIGIEFKPADEQRNTINTTIQVKSTLAPQVGVATTLLVGKDTKNNKIVANELKSGAVGQTYFDETDSTLKDDTGNPIDTDNSHVIDFRKDAK